MRGRTRIIIKRMCCIGGIGISNKNKNSLENDSPEPHIPNKFYYTWY